VETSVLTRRIDMFPEGCLLSHSVTLLSACINMSNLPSLPRNQSAVWGHKLAGCNANSKWVHESNDYSAGLPTAIETIYMTRIAQFVKRPELQSMYFTFESHCSRILFLIKPFSKPHSKLLALLQNAAVKIMVVPAIG